VTGFRETLEGDARLVRRLAGLTGHYRAEAKKTLAVGGERVRNTAIAGIKGPPKTGRLYTHRFPYVFGQENPPASHARAPHRASAQGEYPAADTGNLMGSIHAEVEDLSGVDFAAAQLSFDFGDALAAGQRLAAVIAADAAYAAPLEYKPPEKGGRPFLRRSLTDSADAISDLFHALKRFDPSGIA
jgi:hypothetical protein